MNATDMKPEMQTVKKRSRTLPVLGLIMVLGAVGYWMIHRNQETTEKGATYKARVGPLQIRVLEGGSVQALESQELKCEVRVGYQGTKILKIVEEGYLVTEEDVKNGKVLVELDSSEIQKQLTQQEIQFESATAAYTDAQQAHEIQRNQNLSDIMAAEQKARFARLDFDKFLGADAAQGVLAGLGLDRSHAQQLAAGRSAEAVTPAVSRKSDSPKVVPVQNASGSGAGKSEADVPLPPVVGSAAVTPDEGNVQVDFSRFATLEALGDGEAKQKLRKLLDDHQVAQKELEQARATLDGTRKLFSGGFVTKTDLQRDEIAHENSRLKVQTADTAKNLFLKYELIKSAEEFLSKYSEALREVERARKAAVSKLAQTEAKLKSAQGQYNVQQRQRKDYQEQIEKCIMKAKKTGLVVYGAAGDQFMYYGGEERIREGATVRERQTIITIPDMTQMSVRVAIHESYIKKIKKGQVARVTADAFPDKNLKGEVTKVGVLPDSQNRWMNPDLKVYLTTITIQGTHDWLKPGMTAKVEIEVGHVKEALQIPLQAVFPVNGKQYCTVVGGTRSGQREIEVGEFNDEFIQVKGGLSEGEEVLLSQPGPTTAPSTTTPEPSRTTQDPKPTTSASPGKV